MGAHVHLPFSSASNGMAKKGGVLTAKEMSSAHKMLMFRVRTEHLQMPIRLLCTNMLTVQPGFSVGP